MTGDTAIRIALGAALALGLGLAAAIAITGTRGDPASPATTTARSVPDGPRVSVEDTQVLARVRPWIREWNTASEAWVKALSAGRPRFLRAYEPHTRRMDVNSLRIRLAAAQLQNRRLRTLFRRLGEVYRRQFDAVRDVNTAVVLDDPQATRAGVLRLEQAEEDKTRAATALIDAFPELGGDLNRLR